jgi:hypothetical protein
VTCHLFTLPDFTWVLALTDRTGKSVSFGVSVCSVLTTEIPSFHDTLVSLTLALGGDVYKLSDIEVRWAQQITYWQEVFLSHLELCKMLLGWKSILQEVASLWFLQSFKVLFTESNLDCV